MPAFDDLPEAETPDRDDDAALIDLDPGESVVGKLAHIERDTGENNNNMIHLIVEGEPRKRWSNQTIDRELEKKDASPGDIVGLAKAEEQESFTNDDGEEVAYYPYDVRVGKDGEF